MKYSTQFLEGHKNAQLSMGDLMFGNFPYAPNTIEFGEWNNGFQHAFSIGAL